MSATNSAQQRLNKGTEKGNSRSREAGKGVLWRRLQLTPQATAMLTVLHPQGPVRAGSYLLLQLREDELVQDIVQDPHRDDVHPAVQEVHHWLAIPRLPLGDNIPNKRHPDLPHEPATGKAAGQPHGWLHSAHSVPAHRPSQETSGQCPQGPLWLSVSTGLSAAFPPRASVHSTAHTWGHSFTVPC